MTQPASTIAQPSPRLPREQIRRIIERISGVQVRWRDHKRPHMGQVPTGEHAWILLSVGTIVRYGRDEQRTTFDPTAQNLDQLRGGQRGLTLTVEARSTDTSIEPFDLLERVAFRIRTATAHAMMTPNIALRDIQPIRVLSPEVAENRAILRATVDVRLIYAVSADPMDPGEGDWIETVDGGQVPPGTLI